MNFVRINDGVIFVRNNDSDMLKVWKEIRQASDTGHFQLICTNSGDREQFKRLWYNARVNVTLLDISHLHRPFLLELGQLTKRIFEKTRGFMSPFPQ